MSKNYIFVIDTEQYSGNFEREMCAYVTGAVGDCGVGDREQDLFFEECDDKFEYITKRADDDGCHRPCAIYPTPGWYNDGNGKNYRASEADGKKKQYISYQSVAIYMDSMPPDEHIELFKTRAKQYCEYMADPKRSEFSTSKKIKVIGFRLISEETIVKEEAVWND